MALTMNWQQNRRAASGEGGFTLIELLIAVAIIAILAVVALNSYQNAVVRSHRSAAKACVSQYSQFMERYYTTQLTYVDADPVLGCSTEGEMDDRYTITIEDAGANTYTVTATPTASWAARDTRCSTLTLDQAGERLAGDGSAEDVAHCW